jgi:hypothetical protein
MLKALPGRRIDIANLQAELNDLYTAAFVRELEHSITEPNIDQGQEIKMILMNAIVDAWHGSFHRDHRNCHADTMEGVFWAALPGLARAAGALCQCALLRGKLGRPL